MGDRYAHQSAEIAKTLDARYNQSKAGIQAKIDELRAETEKEKQAQDFVAPQDPIPEEVTDAPQQDPEPETGTDKDLVPESAEEAEVVSEEEAPTSEEESGVKEQSQTEE